LSIVYHIFTYISIAILHIFLEIFIRGDGLIVLCCYKMIGKIQKRQQTMDYDEKFDEDFWELFTNQLVENESFGHKLWSALANVD